MILLITGAAIGHATAESGKYKNAVAVRNVVDRCNVDKFGMKLETCLSATSYIKDIVEKSLQTSGYLATAAPKYYVDVDVREIQVRMVVVAVDVATKINYTVSGAGPRSYPVQATGTASIVSMPLGLLRIQAAYADALEKSARQFTQRLR